MEVWCVSPKEATKLVRLQERSTWQERACCRASTWASLYAKVSFHEDLERRLRYQEAQWLLHLGRIQRELSLHHASMDTIMFPEAMMLQAFARGGGIISRSTTPSAITNIS
jgi:hypothetical protein